jgi:predicted DNA-binding transcriptional regulator YafY
VTSSDTHGFRWGIERRLEFIEFRLFWEGGVNRSDIVDEFGVSVPQASKDLTLYQGHAPDNILYDRSQKRYFASEKFQPKFISLDADAYLDHLTAESQSIRAERPEATVNSFGAYKLPIPQRRIEPEVLRALLSCMRGNGSIEILYQSMSATRPEPIWRRISPHAFGSDGLRWHTRAFCHIDQKFKDFILSRCMGARLPDAAGASASDDPFWAKYFSVVLCPNPHLTADQQKVIAGDFAMENGEVAVPVRRALLYYFSKRLRLDVADRFDDPSEAPVVVKNRDAFDVALVEATR